MDEVDGMSAGDRGGSAELIQLIKKTSVPIICICNDHSSPKMKSLAGHCFDLKFRRFIVLYLPIRASAQQVEKRLTMIAAKEKLKLESNVVGELVASTTGDIRQMLNLLSTFRLRANVLSYDETKKL
jgi:replication factor C subunit 1